jgi:hypothetical protein
MLHFKGVTMIKDHARGSSSMVHLEPAEVLALLRTAKMRGAREWSMILLAYKHGMRASEVCDVRLDDVDLKNGSIVVDRLKGSLRTVQAMTEHRGEPLLNELRAVREWLKQRPNDGSDFLFVSQKGGRLDRSQFFRLFQSIAEAAGLPPEKRHPHALKHSIASHLVSQNVNLALVKQQLGHKSIGSTMRYVTTSDQQASRVYMVLGERYGLQLAGGRRNRLQLIARTGDGAAALTSVEPPWWLYRRSTWMCPLRRSGSLPCDCVASGYGPVTPDEFLQLDADNTANRIELQKIQSTDAVLILAHDGLAQAQGDGQILLAEPSLFANRTQQGEQDVLPFPAAAQSWSALPHETARIEDP